MNFYKKLFLLLISTHIAFSNSHKSYFTLKDINPVHFGITFASAFFLGAYYMKKSYDTRLGESKKKLEEELVKVKQELGKHKGFLKFLNANSAIIRIQSCKKLSEKYPTLVELFASASYGIESYTIKEIK